MTAIRRSKADRPLLDSRVAAVSVFAAGLAITVFLSLSAENPDFARARYSVWPVIALGGWAVALMIRHGFTLALGATHWRWWWSAGLAAYAVHLYWGFGAIYAWDLGLVVEGQGAIVAVANFALLVLWIASVGAACTGVPANWLHVLTAGLFVIATLASTILFGRGMSAFGGVMVLLLWLTAFYLRVPKRKT